jgi:hypothetical protein
MAWPGWTVWTGLVLALLAVACARGGKRKQISLSLGSRPTPGAAAPDILGSGGALPGLLQLRGICFGFGTR